MTKTEESLTGLIGYIIGFFLIPWLFYWYNSVLHWYQLGYWQWFLITLGWIVAHKLFPPARFMAGAIGFVCVMAQVLGWAGVIALPLIKP